MSDTEICGVETSSGSKCQNPAGDDGTCYIDSHTPEDTSTDSADILEEAQEDYQDKQRQSNELKNALVEEHGSPFVETDVDLETGDPVPISGRAGGSLIELIGKVSKILNDPRIQGDEHRPEDAEKIMSEIAELAGGIDGVIDALAELCDDETMDTEFFRDLYRTDLVTFLTVAQKVYQAIQEEQEEASKSFR